MTYNNLILKLKTDIPVDPDFSVCDRRSVPLWIFPLWNFPFAIFDTAYINDYCMSKPTGHFLIYTMTDGPISDKINHHLISTAPNMWSTDETRFLYLRLLPRAWALVWPRKYLFSFSVYYSVSIFPLVWIFLSITIFPSARFPTLQKIFLTPFSSKNLMPFFCCFSKTFLPCGNFKLTKLCRTMSIFKFCVPTLPCHVMFWWHIWYCSNFIEMISEHIPNNNFPYMSLDKLLCYVMSSRHRGSISVFFTAGCWIFFDTSCLTLIVKCTIAILKSRVTFLRWNNVGVISWNGFNPLRASNSRSINHVAIIYLNKFIINLKLLQLLHDSTRWLIAFSTWLHTVRLVKYEMPSVTQWRWPINVKQHPKCYIFILTKDQVILLCF